MLIRTWFFSWGFYSEQSLKGCVVYFGVEPKGRLAYEYNRPIIKHWMAPAMEIKTKLGLVTALAILLVASTAMADKVCLQTTVNKKTFKVTNKTVTAATCPKGYTALVDSPTSPGEVTSRCVKRTNSVTGVGAFSVSIGCATNEYITATGCSANGVGAVGSQILSTGDNSLLGPNIYGILNCISYDVLFTGTTPYTTTAQAQCCKGS